MSTALQEYKHRRAEFPPKLASQTRIKPFIKISAHDKHNNEVWKKHAGWQTSRFFFLSGARYAALSRKTVPSTLRLSSWTKPYNMLLAEVLRVFITLGWIEKLYYWSWLSHFLNIRGETWSQVPFNLQQVAFLKSLLNHLQKEKRCAGIAAMKAPLNAHPPPKACQWDEHTGHFRY